MEQATPAKPKDERQWAKYYVCPVCRQAMTMKVGRLVEVSLGVYTHKMCAEIFRRSVKSGIEKYKEEAKDAAGE